MTTLQIRVYRESDQDAVVALWRESGLVRPWNDPVKDIHRKLRVQRDLFLVGTVDGRLVATVMAGYEGGHGPTAAWQWTDDRFTHISLEYSEPGGWANSRASRGVAGIRSPPAASPVDHPPAVHLTILRSAPAVRSRAPCREYGAAPWQRR